MRYQSFLFLGLMSLFFIIASTVPGLCQYREYYIYGKVLDTKDQPIPKVEIFLRNTRTSRSYRIITDKKGEFKLVGLPHGIYQVTIQKEGYKTQTAEWNFETPQERMLKVEMQTIVMATEEQIREFERAKQAEADFNQATEKMQQNDFDGAITILKKMVEENPDDANALYFLGISYIKKNKFSNAIEALIKTTELSPSFPGAYHQLGICYRQQNELDKALQYYQIALELKPDSVDSLYNRGLILFELNRIEEALTHFEKALELKPDDPEFLEMAGRCYIHQGDFLKAIEYLKKARDGYSDQEKIKFLDQLITKLKEQIKE
ncbi:MAG: tetratricopeptide repeat protein [Candidatus Aenigmarchaeota archaeon]|nr:tetratricopeptide repeat protein [Candidatus Aenigmarchaeota archaeon]